MKLMKYLRHLRPFTKILLALALILALIAPAGLLHAQCGDPSSSGVTGGIACGPSSISATEGVKRAINILLYLVGVISLIVVVVGALRYVLSGGNPQATSAAKDTILYAVIGLVVALLAYAIVNFVLSNFGA